MSSPATSHDELKTPVKIRTLPDRRSIASPVAIPTSKIIGLVVGEGSVDADYDVTFRDGNSPCVDADGRHASTRVCGDH